MNALRPLRHYPLAVFGLAAVAFVGWIWWDARPARTLVGVEDGDLIGRLEIEGPPTRVSQSRQFGEDDPSERPRGVSKLKPGMPRAEVEKLVGAPAADHVSPATVTDGRVTYHAAYEADFGPAPTVRPIGAGRSRPPADPTSTPADRTLVTLEFDATKPGHPLVGIHYPDPLF